MGTPTLTQILQAVNGEDLFGDPTTDPTKAEKRYKRLLRIAHPDLNVGNEDEANKAFIHLNELWKKAAGIATPSAANKITTKRHEYTFGNKRYQTDGVVYYDSTYDAGHEKAGIMFANNPKLNGMFSDGVKNLRAVRRAAEEGFKPYFSEIIDTFSFQNGTERLSGAAFNSLRGLYSLHEILNDYPEGIDGRDVAWMYRRMLIAVGNTHDAGFIHGGAHLDSFLIHPKFHGLVLINWQYSVEKGAPAHALAKSAQKIYPKYVLDKEPLKTDLDISLASNAALQLLDGKAPKRLRTFIKNMALYPEKDAANALYETDEMLKEVYGPKTFHEFRMKNPRK